MKAFIAPEIEEYVFAHARAPGPLFEELRTRTYAEAVGPEMQVGRVEGALLRILVATLGARRILEIGTFTGFSALSMAESLPEDGVLITCDIDPVATKIAQSFFDRSPHGRKIQLRLGDALTTVRSMIASVASGEPLFDIVFLDADKERYPTYFEATFPLLRPGGLLLADNALWSGDVLDPQTPAARAIAKMNDLITEDPRMDNVLLPVRDGLMIARKRP